MVDIAWFGGARSGTDAAKLVGLGVNAIGYGVAVALALGGEITQTGMRFAPDRTEEERAGAVVNILKANAGEASMMARCAGKTRLHNIEPEDLRSITRATAAATGIRSRGRGRRSSNIAPPGGCGHRLCTAHTLPVQWVQSSRCSTRWQSGSTRWQMVGTFRPFAGTESVRRHATSVPWAVIFS